MRDRKIKRAKGLGIIGIILLLMSIIFYVLSLKEKAEVLKSDLTGMLINYTEEGLKNSRQDCRDIMVFSNIIKKFQGNKDAKILKALEMSYTGEGMAYFCQHKFPKAIDAYINSLEINSSQPLSYIDLFHLQLIENQPFNEKLERLYREKFHDDKESFIKYEMFKVLQNIVNHKEDTLSVWEEKYQGMGLNNWNFYYLDEWIKKRKEDEVKDKLLDALKIFKTYK